MGWAVKIELPKKQYSLTAVCKNKRMSLDIRSLTVTLYIRRDNMEK